MKINVLVHDLSSNPIVRASTFIDVLTKLGHDVTVHGVSYDGTIYKPYTNNFNFKVYDLSNLGFFKAYFLLYKGLDGDLVYSFKPLITTFLPGLIYKFFNKDKILFLDIEDNDISIDKKTFKEFLFFWLRGWRTITSYPYNKWLCLFLRYVNSTSVSSTKLQNYYSGEIIRCCDIDETFKFTQIFNKRLKLYFCGSLKHYKGLDMLKCLLETSIFKERYELHLIGDKNQESFEILNDISEHVYLHGFVDKKILCECINQFNIALILQESNNFTEAQLPAKLIEALAAGKVPIYTDVADIDYIVNSEFDCGYKISNIDDLVECLFNLSNEDVLLKSINCRLNYEKFYSHEKVKDNLLQFIKQ